MYCVYGLYKKNKQYETNSLSENLFYIGITSYKNIYFRMYNHKREKSNPYKLNIIAKYDFFYKIFWSVDTLKEAEDREGFLIRWFGKITDGSGILSNILSDSKDHSKIHKKQSETTRKKISKALKKIYKYEDKIIENRDRNLTIPYNKVIQIIEEWAKNPLETQQDFASRKNIRRSKFKDWLRLYRPEYVGLTKKKQLEIFNKVYDKEKPVNEIISLYSMETGYSFIKAKGVYYNIMKKLN